MVIDPLAHYRGIKADFYTGCYIADKRYIEDWIIHRTNPLEIYVEEKNRKEHQERIHQSYMESYYTQLSHEPGWFPDQLIDFAKKEGLYIPPQKRH